MKQGIASANISPDTLKLVAIAVVCASIYLTWDTLQTVPTNMSRQAVYGEQSRESTQAVSPTLLALPIVQSATETHEDKTTEVVDAQAIESAFQLPAPPATPAPPKFNLSQQLIAQHKPALAGVASNGAFFAGHFWSVGEQITPFTVLTEKGERVVPTLASIGKNTAAISVGGEVLTFRVEAY